jgi:hypothetical protein
MRISWLAVAAWLLAGLPPPALAQPAAPGNNTETEIMFWNVAQHSEGLAGYRSYLMLFPDGKFAALAKLRAGDQTPPPDPLSPYRLTASPYVAPNSTPTHIICTGFGAPALFDYLVVVPAGAPDFDPATDGKQALYTDLPNIRPCTGTGLQLPVTPAGSYEARYISRSSTPDGSLKVLARAGFLSQ